MIARCFALSIILMLGLVSGAFAATPQEEIEQLLLQLGRLENVAFLRNDTAHTPAEAVAHLRLKWEKQQSRIRTTEDFIELCGTKSSVSGTRYQLRFKDGNVKDSAAVLRQLLAEIRQSRDTIR